MATTAAQPIQLDDNTSPRDLIALYGEGASRLERGVAGMSRQQLLARPIAGKWSTLEVVCHISDTEQVFADRIKRTLSMPKPLLMVMDETAYVAALAYEQRSLTEELALVELTRSQIARILSNIPAEAWQRTGVHSEAGLVTVRELVIKAIRHLEHHLAKIYEKRQALGL